MKKNLTLALILTALLVGCASTKTTISVEPGVRKMSYADDTLFRDLLISLGGVGHSDNVLYPKSKHKMITRIEAVTPYDNQQTGVERWYVQHDGKDTCVYLVKMSPDGKGGTDFTVQKDSTQ